MKRHRANPALLGGLAGLVGVLALVGVVLWRAPAGVAQEQQPIVTYPEYPPTPTVGPNPSAAPGLAGAELFREGFDSESALARLSLVDLEPVLSTQRANWLVEQVGGDGRLLQANAGPANNASTHRAAALVAGGSYGDVAVRASFYDEYAGVAGLIARFNGDVPGEASYYRYTILKNEYEAEPKQRLEKVVDGVATSLVEIKSRGFTPREWHVIEMSVVGSAITVTLDGEVVVTAVDPQPLPAGSAGVHARAFGGIFYDDLIVSQP
jgi:hypothetical protein